jgi:thiol-disulfide isomerase/thioredoxin
MDESSPWGWFALAACFNRFQSRDAYRADEATDAARKVLAYAPTDLVFLWLHAEVLRHYDHDTTAINFLDSLPPELSEQPLLLARRGEALFSLAYRFDDPGKRQEAQEAFARARAVDSMNLEAYHRAGEYLVRDRRIEEALPLLRRAASLSDATAVHDDLWYATLGRDDLTEEEKHAEIEADARALLESRGNLPRTLRHIAGIFDELGLDAEQQELQERLLELYPTSFDAEWVFVGRNRELRQAFYDSRTEDGAVDSTKREQLIQGLNDFVERPHHHQPSILGEAYMTLFMMVRDDSTVSNDDFYEIVTGMVEYQDLNPHIVYPEGAIALAERRTHLEEAARIARLGVNAGKREVDENRGHGFYDSEGEYEQSLHYYSSMMADALGWVYYHEDRFDDAENELVQAIEFSPGNRKARHHLGQLYETRARIAADGTGPEALRAEAEYLDAAEEQYMRGVMTQSRGPNPNEDALESLYEKTHGTAEGYETYRANIEEIDRERRRDKVLGEKIADPTRIEAFSLNTLDGNVVSWEDIRGAVVVINFWNTSCGPCVAEMPELQQFHERFRSEPGVVVLTVSNDLIADDVREWMNKNEYDFTVLMDDGYMGRVGITGYPTTWFIDAHEWIRFMKRGWSDALNEEFGWRVEDLRAAEGT